MLNIIICSIPCIQHNVGVEREREGGESSVDDEDGTVITLNFTSNCILWFTAIFHIRPNLNTLSHLS